MRIIGCIGLALVIGTAGLPAHAQTMIDMKGTWKATAEAIVDGLAPHHPANAEAKAAGNYRLRKQDFTYKIEGQDARRFWGTFNSEYSSSGILGSVSADGKWIYVANRDGLGDGQVIDNDTIAMCWRQVAPNAVMVGCMEMKRQK